jgi:hypothetical protein
MESESDLSARVLAGRLGDQMSRLVSDEIALAKAEMVAGGRQAALGGGMLGGAAIVAFTAWLAMIAGAVAGIGRALPIWASALIVGGALAVIAGALAMIGRSRLRRGKPSLPVTADSVRKDISALAAATTAAGRTVSGAAHQAPVPRQEAPARAPTARRDALEPGAPR